MIIETTEEVPAKTLTRKHMRCDACGKEQTNREWPAEQSDYEGSYCHAAFEVTVPMTVRGVGYEGDGGREGVAWDFCPDCFEKHIRPLLETIAKPREVDESW